MRYIVLFLIMFSSFTLYSRDINELKVVSWNIWHKGHSKEFPYKGCSGTIDLLKEIDADIYLVVETYGASNMIADSLGYYHRLLSDNLSVYSRYPIVKTYTFPERINTFNFGGVLVNVNGVNIRCFCTWLHYLPDSRLVPTDNSEKAILEWDNAGTRDDEIFNILSVIKPYIKESDDIPLIIGGDFNVHSHLDWGEETRWLYNHGGAVVKWTVSSLMYENGFIDSYRRVHPFPEKDLGVTWVYEGDTFDKPNRKDRIDFIYYKGSSIDVIDSKTIYGRVGELMKYNNKDFFYASDHGIVISTFKIKNKTN